MLRGKPRSLTAQRRVCRSVYHVFLSTMHSNNIFHAFWYLWQRLLCDEVEVAENFLEERVFTSDVEDLLYLSMSFIGLRMSNRERRDIF